jgi:hypothetical protein
MDTPEVDSLLKNVTTSKARGPKKQEARILSASGPLKSELEGV